MASRAANLAPPLVATGAAVGLSVAVNRFVPLLSPLLLALAIGLVVGNTPLADHRALRDHAAVTSLALRLGIVALGLQLPLTDIAAIGWRGAAVVVVTVAATYALTRFIGVRLGLDRRFVTVLAAGFSICGAAAIAAVSEAVRARQRDVALAVAMVTIFGSVMIVALPWTAHLIGLGEAEAAIWAGAAIHEVAQVLAAASLVGAGALGVASVIKLGRVALLAPVYLVSAAGAPSGAADKARVPVLPWFLLGFGVAVAVRSLVPLPPVVLGAAGIATTALLAAGMFGLGVGCRFRDLWPVPARALALATASTLIAALVPLTLIAALY